MPEYKYIRARFTDHEFAAWLRKHNAVDNYKSLYEDGSLVQWFDNPECIGDPVATCIYDNAECTKDISIRRDLAEARQ